MNTDKVGKERLDIIYSRLMESAIDFIFPVEPFGFAEFQESYLSGQLAD